jgi:hypothetical protein
MILYFNHHIFQHWKYMLNFTAVFDVFTWWAHFKPTIVIADEHMVKDCPAHMCAHFDILLYTLEPWTTIGIHGHYVVPFISTIESKPWYLLSWNIVAQESNTESMMCLCIVSNKVAGLLPIRMARRLCVQQWAICWRPCSNLKGSNEFYPVVHNLTSSLTNLSHEPPLAYMGVMVVPFVSTMERKWWPWYFLSWNKVDQESGTESVMCFHMPSNNVAGLPPSRQNGREIARATMSRILNAPLQLGQGGNKLHPMVL